MKRDPYTLTAVDYAAIDRLTRERLGHHNATVAHLLRGGGESVAAGIYDALEGRDSHAGAHLAGVPNLYVNAWDTWSPLLRAACEALAAEAEAILER